MDSDQPWVFLPEPEPAPEKLPETARQVIRWWERRRWKYNLAILALYFLGETIAISLYPGYVKRTGVLEEWGLVGIFAVVDCVGMLIAANILYTFGWISHLVIGSICGCRADRFGPVAYGLANAVSVVTLAGYFVLVALHLIHGTPPRR